LLAYERKSERLRLRLPDNAVYSIDKILIPLLGLEECDFRPLPLGHVLDDRHPAYYVSRCVPQRSGGYHYVKGDIARSRSVKAFPAHALAAYSPLVYIVERLVRETMYIEADYFLLRR